MSDCLQTQTRSERHQRVSELTARYAEKPAGEVIRHLIQDEFPGQITLVSSFGAESAILLSLAAKADPTVPVLFLNTLRHYPETLDYVATLKGRLGLENVVVVEPRPADIKAEDPDGHLAERDSDRCCYIRKTLPMIRHLSGYKAWITGRKRFQNASRKALDLFEVEERWIKVNPLASWTQEDIREYSRRHELPPHPLVAMGFPSIGCHPCTSPVQPGDDARAGRWRGQDKSECGIHFVDGRMVRSGRQSGD